MEHKVALIVVWLGKLPAHFPIWKLSVSRNLDFDFLFFTDQKVVSSSCPANLKVISTDLSFIKKLIESKLGITPTISHSYKLCDFKPCYGEMFSDFLTDYDFWGNCDIDLLFGNLKSFINDDVLSRYDKILIRGHLTLYRNRKYINQLYKSSKLIDFNAILTSNEYWMFDEWHGINKIFIERKVDQYHEEIMADISPNTASFRCCNIKNHRWQTFVWRDGEVLQFFLENGEIKKKELAYIHFQKRRLRFEQRGSFDRQTIILNSHGFHFFDGQITIDTIKMGNPSNYSHYFSRNYKRAVSRIFPKKNGIKFNKTLLEIKL